MLDDFYIPENPGFGCNCIEEGEVMTFVDRYMDNSGNKGGVTMKVVGA